MHLHHVIPQACRNMLPEGIDVHDKSNLRWLCSSCHILVHAIRKRVLGVQERIPYSKFSMESLNEYKAPSPF